MKKRGISVRSSLSFFFSLFFSSFFFFAFSAEPKVKTIFIHFQVMDLKIKQRILEDLHLI